MRNLFGVLILGAALCGATPLAAQNGTGSLDITVQITPTGEGRRPFGNSRYAC